MDIGQSLSTQPNRLLGNCYCLLAVLDSVNRDSTGNPLLSKVYNRCFDSLVSYMSQLLAGSQLEAAGLEQVWMVLRVCCRLFELMDATKMFPIWNAIIRDNRLIEQFIRVIQLENPRILTITFKALSLILEADKIVKADVIGELCSMGHSENSKYR